jgi:hypothetical protein
MDSFAQTCKFVSFLSNLVFTKRKKNAPKNSTPIVKNGTAHFA